jgi:hypothetical protein
LQALSQVRKAVSSNEKNVIVTICDDKSKNLVCGNAKVRNAKVLVCVVLAGYPRDGYFNRLQPVAHSYWRRLLFASLRSCNR